MDAINLRITAAAALSAVLACSLPAEAQRVLEVPVRTGVGADALSTGPVAVFWNPASLGEWTGQGEALLLDARGPTATGLDGLGVAATYRPGDRTTVGFGFQHSGIDDMERTTTSPLPTDGAVPIDVSENTFSVAAARLLGERTMIGGAVRYTRVADIVGGEHVAAIGVGGRHAFSAFHGIEPRIAAGAFFDRDGADWFAGAAVQRPIGEETTSSVGAEYGIRDSPRSDGTEHRIAATGTLRGRLRVGLGVVVEPGADGHTAEPAGSAELAINRYMVGIVREHLPNDLGAVHHFRFSVRF